MTCSALSSIWTSASRARRAPARATCAAVLAIAALLPQPLRAQTDELQVRPADREELTQAPRDAVAITFVVRNGTGRSIDAEAHLTLPPGWRAITTDLPFALTERATAIRLV